MRLILVVISTLLATPALAGGANKAKVIHAEEDALTEGNATYYTAEGGVVLSPAGKPICVVPPAAGARQISADSSFNVKGGKGDVSVDVGASHNRDHEIAKLFEQQQGVLFLQFAMYRLCEAARNKDFDPNGDLTVEDSAGNKTTSKAYVALFQGILNAAKDIAEAEVKVANAAMEAAESKKEEAEAKAAKAQADATALRALSTPVRPVQ